MCLFLSEENGREIILVIETYTLNCAFPWTGVAGKYNQKSPNYISFFFFPVKLLSWNAHLSTLQKFLEALSISTLGI